MCGGRLRNGWFLMREISRRKFLKSASQTGLVMSAAAIAGRMGTAQSATTRVVIDTDRQIAPVSHELFGSFLEQLGRAIYEGVYEPGSKLSNAQGFRNDVIAEVRELQVPIVRWPGGNFVSGYHWLDGVGPKEKRPTVLDRAWNTLETNQFGTNEFLTWARLVGTEPLMGLNFGTGSAEDAAALVEYCNVAGGTKWSELRRSHGYAEPYGVKFWCVGNEMDGPWQIGHMPAQRIWLESNRRCAADARGRSIDQVDRLRIERTVHAYVYRVGSHCPRRMLRRGRWNLPAPLLGKYRGDPS